MAPIDLPPLSQVTLAATLTTWLRAWRAGLAAEDDVVYHVEHAIRELVGHDHMVLEQQTFDASERRVEPLRSALRGLQEISPERIRLVLPTPGDTRGLPNYSVAAPAATKRFIADAIQAGCAVICGAGDATGRALGFIANPVPGRMVEWRRYELELLPEPARTANALPSWAIPPADSDTPADTGAALIDELHDGTDLLQRLELAPVALEHAERLAALRRQGVRGPQLPPGYAERNRLRLARAGMVLGIAEIALSDDSGGAVDSHQLAARAAALRTITTAARRSYCAAVNSPLETALPTSTHYHERDHTADPLPRA